MGYLWVPKTALHGGLGCGTLLCMPNQLDLQAMREAQDAVLFAQAVRQRHRRRTARGTAQREQDIQVALARLREAMRPLRSEIGRFSRVHASPAAEIVREDVRAASEAIQRERRKLFKMKARTK